MRKREFLRRLGQELSHLDRDERNDILDYYDELIEDRIEKTGNSESDVIYDLGEIEDIARRVDPTHRRKFKYEEEEELPRKKSRRRRSSKSIIGIILSICLIPLWIVIFVTLFAAIVTILCAGVGSFAGGVICIWHGCTLFTSAWAQGLFRIGIGIIVLGIVCIIAPILLKLVHIIGKIFISFIRWLFGGRRRYA